MFSDDFVGLFYYLLVLHCVLCVCCVEAFKFLLEKENNNDLST